MRAILVSHGQPSEPEVGEAEIAALAQATGPGVLGATLAADGALEAALARAPGAPVVPVFMSDGWFTRVALPRRLGNGAGPLLAPLGTWPALAEVAARWLTEEIAAQCWAAADTTLVIAAHGSGRSPYAALDTRIFADRLARRLRLRALRCGFVEQRPRLVEALSGHGQKAVCLPFFAARRGHVLDDLPEAVTASHFDGLLLAPIGLHHQVPALIARALSGQPEDANHAGHQQRA
ncbi:MAG: cobalamin biosynthesis protein CbiX [Roseivivax sp.]|nr:cobalamin biosynthesis protein CbiX [Roseivivax sp.]